MSGMKTGDDVTTSPRLLCTCTAEMQSQQQGAQARNAAHPAAVLATWACVARKARHSAAQRGDRIVFGDYEARAQDIRIALPWLAGKIIGLRMLAGN